MDKGVEIDVGVDLSTAGKTVSRRSKIFPTKPFSSFVHHHIHDVQCAYQDHLVGEHTEDVTMDPLGSVGRPEASA